MTPFSRDKRVPSLTVVWVAPVAAGARSATKIRDARI